MKIKIANLLFLLLLTINNLAFSANVSVKKAHTVAVNFAKQQIDAKTTDMSLVYTKDNTAYVFSNENMWVMIAADDRAKPVLAYSTEGSFRVPKHANDTTIGNNFWGWIKSYQEQIRFVVENNIAATDEIKNQWETLSSDKIASQARNDRSTTTVVNPLLTTTWGQGWPYNSMCPSDPAGPNGHVWAGCVATAMAQIMKYHNYPSQGLGSYGYQFANYPYTEANFGNTTYNWSNMPNSISTVNTDVATITYHAAVSTLSMWGSASTGVGWYDDQEPMSRAWVNYFRMAYSSLEYVKRFNWNGNDFVIDPNWDDKIQAELLANRPVYYRGSGTSGHAWVCDGVDNDMYHFNWGWDGSYNGYYSLDAINPGNQHFNNNQSAVIGIKPNDGSTLVTNTTWSGNLNHTSKIAVPDAITLTVNPGATILFAQGSKLQVYGRLLSIGTADNYVRFSSIDTNNRWHGIKWDNEYNWYDVMADNDSSKLIYTQVEFSGYRGLYASRFGKILVKNSKINNNHSGYGSEMGSGIGGGIFVLWHSIDIWNNQIYKNYANVWGGGIFIQYTQDGTSNICQNDIYDNVSDDGGGGALAMFYGNANIISNTISNNQSVGGAGILLLNSSPLIENNILVNNSSSWFGGGTLYLAGSNANIVGNLIANNDANGISIYYGSAPTIINSTIVNNYSYYAAGMVFEQGSDPIIKNCIIYGNIAQDPSQGSQIRIIDADSDPVFDHCDIQGGLAGFGGAGAGSNYNPANYTNNIDADPLWQNPTTGAGAGYDGLLADYSVQGNSPCIDAGTTNGIINLLPALDLADNPRINGIIDMGAYEYCAPAQPSTITGNANPCQGGSQAYSVTNVTGISYNWTVPSTWTITAGQGTNSITATVGSTSGNISVTPSNSCGNGTPSTLAVMVNALPTQPSTIAGNANPCQANSQVYSVTNVTGISYTWTVPSTWTITAGQGTNSITATVGSASGNITVTPSNSCGNGTPRTLAVTVNYVPGAASQPDGPDSVDLHYTSVSQYTTIPVANTDYYNWILEPANMGTISGNGSSISITWSGILGIASLSVQAVNACGAGMGSNTLLIHVDNSVGLDNPSINKLSIYPNPSNGRFTITSNRVISAVYLYDVSGRQIPPSPPFVKGALVEMNCGHLPKGLYFVHVYSEGILTVKKLSLIP